MEQVKNDQIVAEKELYKLEDEVDFLKEQEATIKIEMKRQQGLKDTTTTASNRSTTPSTNGSFMWPAKGLSLLDMVLVGEDYMLGLTWQIVQIMFP